MLGSLFVLFLLVASTLAALIALCIDPDPSTCPGYLSHLVQEIVPEQIQTLLLRIPGGRLVHSCGSRVVDRLCFKPNPVLQIVYLTLIAGGYVIYLLLYAHLVPNPYLGEIHMVLPFVLVNTTLFSFIKASLKQPGTVTPANQAALEQIYPYDGFIFVRRECETCKTMRVARSKHDKFTNRCVERFDHFCPWINNAVGARNYRYFLAFVSSTALLLVYASYVLSCLILHVIAKEQLFKVTFINHMTKETSVGDWKVVGQYMLSAYGLLLFLWIMSTVMGLTMVGFSLYHGYLVCQGTTTNESAKWAGMKDYYKTVLSKRKTLPPSDEALVHATMPPLEQREPKDFPSDLPRNIYNKGWIENWKQVLWPPLLPLPAATMKKTQ